MDILLPNFPHMFAPGSKPCSAADKVARITLEGERGITRDEAQSARDVEQCDQTYLDGIIEKLQLVELRVCNYGNRYQGHHIHDPLQRDPDQDLRDAFALISVLLTEVSRLGEHSEVFSDVRQRNEFFVRASKIMKFSRKLLDLTEEADTFAARSQKRIDDWTSSSPINPKTGQKFQPWESFGRRMPLLSNSPAVAEIQSLVPDMRLITAQQLPQSAVLIAERYRQSVESIVTDIMRSSSRPEVVEKQLPGRDGPVSGEKVVEGMSAKVRRPAAMIPMSETTRHAWAFGKQERVAEMARLMALYDQDVTTQIRRPPAAFQATFLSKEGMQVVKESLEEDLEDHM